MEGVFAVAGWQQWETKVPNACSDRQLKTMLHPLFEDSRGVKKIMR